MSKTNEHTITDDIYIEVTVDFDRMSDDIGKFIGGKRFLNPEDMPEILGYMSDQIDADTDAVILCGYLPAFGWIQVGADLMTYHSMNIKYLAQNGFSCELPAVCGGYHYE